MKIIEIFKNYENIKDEYVNLNGWIKHIRSGKKIIFISLNDGSCLENTQIIVFETLENFLEISKLNVGSAIKIKGILKNTPENKQKFEIKADEIIIEGTSASDYPLQKKFHTNEFLRNNLHLRSRTNTFYSVFKIRSILSFAIHKFFNEQGFIYVHTPIITGSDCEGAGEMFKVTSLDLNNLPKKENKTIDFKKDFFVKEAFLTVSGQLEAEAFAQTFGNVYTFGPTFRAENSNTARHAAEFWMVESEIAFADLSDNMKLSENMLKYIINYVLKEGFSEMDFIEKNIENGILKKLDDLINSNFEIITYTEAIKILQKNKKEFIYPVNWGVDLQTEHERYLTEIIFKKPIFVINYPKEIKAFYMRINDDEKTVSAMDCLIPGVGEIIGGSQREERLQFLLDRMKKMNINWENYQSYLELRKYGSVKHSGFGLGFDRILMYITGMSNIRDVIAYPRTANNLT
ncbi:MAG: asparagine--tRNA ligase [Clostridiales bacterium]|jgi:asparaginyl-tRNA synthetase|nr:asparagine--tRNA ligase [Clostridiales bacterium]